MTFLSLCVPYAASYWMKLRINMSATQPVSLSCITLPKII